MTPTPLDPGLPGGAGLPTGTARKHGGSSKLWLAFGGLLVALLLAAVFTLGSLNLPFEPAGWSGLVILYALSTFIVAALLVFGLVLARSLLRLWAERRTGQLGSRFKTKMVLGAMGISLLPLVFLFFISYALLNRTLSKWFPRPLEIATEESRKLLGELGKSEYERLLRIARTAASGPDSGGPDSGGREGDPTGALRRATALGAEAAWSVNAQGQLEAVAGQNAPSLAGSPRFLRSLPSGAEVWEAGPPSPSRRGYGGHARQNPLSFPAGDGGRSGAGNAEYLAARARLAGSRDLLVARQMPPGFLERFREIERQLGTYEAQKRELRAFKTQMLLTLLLFTVLLVFSATWFALFLSKLVTVPIQALAEATREVSRGHFDHRVDVQARDELGILVQSFDQMTAQLGESRRQIDEFTRSLQRAVEELERRRRILEAVVENIPTGVLSLDESGNIQRSNQAVTKIFGERARGARTVAELAGEEATAGIGQLMRKSLRMGAASKELAIALPERVLHAAVTVSSLGPRRANPGFVVVIDDLSELLRAQKAAAWQEVAQRIAHEIKNPLTPIQLSAQRLARQLERAPAAADGEWRALVSECAALIEREAALLKSLVDEFSQFARFPTARLVPADLNAVVTRALEVFAGRLEGVRLEVDLASALPQVKADPELMRRVMVNLIDNAAEAMEGLAAKKLRIATRLDPDGDTVEILVADSGHGISPEDKDKLFLPHFSTKDRGTGLGLAIVGRIIAEHNAAIRVEDNHPAGARFVIRLPVAEVPAASLSADSPGPEA